MISKDQFLKRVYQLNSEVEPGWAESVDANWESAIAAATKINATMPGIGFLSWKKRTNCFVAVCAAIDAMMLRGQLTKDAAFLTMHILSLTNSKYAKAQQQFMLWAPRMSWQEAIEFPRMAIEWFKAARGQ